MKLLGLGFLFLIFLLNTAFPEENSILLLMKKYEQESDLSRKTRRETLGHYYIFTRKDLEIMQAHNLSDVLKSIPMFHFLPNRFGIYTLTNPGERAGISIKYRLYIDDIELSSIQTANPFLVYDHYPLDNINHIEIYYSMGAVSVSNEPAQVIIRMYTKKPERENSSKLRVTKDSRQGYTGNMVFSKLINEDESFLVMVDKSRFDFKSRNVSNGSVSRDEKLKAVYIKYSYHNLTFETGYTSVHRDIFTGFSLDAVPDAGKIDSADFFTYITGYFLSDSSLKINLSYDSQVREYYEQNKEGIFYPLTVYDLLNPIVFYNEKRTFEKYGFYAEKSYKTPENLLFIGAYLKYYRQKLDKALYRLSDGTFSTGLNGFYVKNFRNYSVYIEDTYSLRENISFIGGMRLDTFKFYGSESQSKLNARLGLSSIFDKLYLKGFFSRSYLLPSFYLLENAENNRLSPIDVRVVSGEAGYRFSRNSVLSFTAQFFKAKKHFDFDRTVNKIVNGQDKDFRVFSFLYRQELGLFNTLELNYWFTNQGDTSFSPPNGGYIKLFSELGRLKLYNELVYKTSYRPLFFRFDSSLMYSMSVSYQFDNDITVTFKGYNITGSSVKVARIFPVGMPVEYPAYDRRYTLTVSKVF
ncbi:TonB-dependent receptor plug domain-containing protein [Persephonella sp.]